MKSNDERIAEITLKFDFLRRISNAKSIYKMKGSITQKIQIKHFLQMYSIYIYIDKNLEMRDKFE